MVTGFDIAYATDVALVACTTAGGPNASVLMRIDLATGAAKYVGVLGVPETVTGMSILPTPGADPYGFASPGCFGAPAIGARGVPSLGNTAFAVFNVNGLPGTTGRLIVGGKSLTTPFQLLDLSLFVDALSPATLWLPVSTDSAGGCTVNLPIPNDPLLASQQVFLQFAWLD